MEIIQSLGELASRITKAEHCVAFTGAGVSTLSGIPDFRGPQGLYRKPGMESMFDIERFRRDPSLYYSLSRDLIYSLDDKQPSVVHSCLANLEERGMLKAIITQNVDLLHQKAGSRRVLEIHGSPKRHVCLACGMEKGLEEVISVIKSGGIPSCPACGQALKPGITFFGEALPRAALKEARKEAQAADLMLILGTSLSVYPAAELPIECLEAGGSIVIINDMQTPLDSRASGLFKDLRSSFEELQARLAS